MLRSVESEPVAPLFTMAKKKKTAAPNKNTGAELGQADRLKRLELACGYETAAGFAAFIGIEPRRWYNFQNGSPLSRDVAFQLVQRVPGLSLDWLYFDKADGLPLELARRLGVFDPPPGKSSS